LRIEGFGMNGKAGINSKWTKISFLEDKEKSGMDAERATI
jgi:hypothetical protein